MHTTLRTRLTRAAFLASALAPACDGTVEPPKTLAEPVATVDAGVDEPAPPVLVPNPTGGGRGTRADGGTDAARAPDAGDEDARAGEGEGAADDGMPLFVAVGEEGRTLVSCDDGQSWVADKSTSSAPCSGSACDHSTTVPTGLAYADGRWFVSRGWGNQGPVAWSDDGETWTEVLRGEWNGVAATRGLVFVHTSYNRPMKASSNQGESFDDRPGQSFEGHVRGDVYFLDGKLWMASDMGVVRSSSDQGRTWTSPRTLDGRCMRETQPHQGGMAYDGKGVLLFINTFSGLVCRSTDHGASFQVAGDLGAHATSPLVYAEDQFWVFNGNRLRRSRDGSTWSDERTDARSLMPVARSAGGTWVGADGVYQDQQMLRSKDGRSWERISGDRFRPGHRIRRIVWGLGKKPRACE